MSRRNGSSLFTTTTSSGRAVRNRAPFSWATPSRPPSSSRWAGPTFTSSRTSGSAISARRWISPGALVPISTTIASAWWGQASRVIGTPKWLLRLPTVWCTRPSGAMASAMSARVVVLPELPDRPTTGPANRRRAAFPRSCRARVVSATCTTPTWAPVGRSRVAGCLCTITPATPASAACRTKACPSNRSPAMARYQAPATSLRVSVSTGPAGPAACTVPPVAAAMAALSNIMGPPGRRAPAPGRRRAACATRSAAWSRAPCPR